MTEQVSAFEDWDVSADAEHIREGSIELQNSVHRRWFEKVSLKSPDDFMKWAKQGWRVSTLDKLEIMQGRPIAGRVLEIGAGTAVISSFLSKRPDVTEVVAMDYDPFCVDEMMPLVFEKFGARTDKIKRVLGSYNRIEREAYFDLIVAVGALHHSEDLQISFNAAYAALKPGGVMLISDVCEADTVSQKIMRDRYDTVDPNSVERYGREVKLKDNGDHWYRLSEWIAFAYAAGFDLAPYLFDADRGRPADDRIFRDRATFQGFQIQVFYPYFASNGMYDRLLLVLQKPDAQGVSSLMPAPSDEVAEVSDGDAELLIERQVALRTEQVALRYEAMAERCAMLKERLVQLKSQNEALQKRKESSDQVISKLKDKNKRLIEKIEGARSRNQDLRSKLGSKPGAHGEARTE